MPVQFDLFFHSDDVIAENELRAALRVGNAGAAQSKFNELKACVHDHRILGPASAMIDALGSAPPRDSDAALMYLDRLEREWAPAERDIFGIETQGILAPLWDVVGQALEGVAFDPGHPERHSSRAYLECADWNSVLRVIRAEPELDIQPVLLERMAEALWQIGQTALAIERWFTLCWLAPAYFEKLMDDGYISASILQRHWNETINVEMEPELTTEWYPTWVMLREPGLARAISSRGADTGPERAFDLVRELMTGNDEHLELRRKLKDIHPGLFHYFLQYRIHFLRG